jgi:hypothetical protein
VASAPARKHASTLAFNSESRTLVWARTTKVPAAYAWIMLGADPPSVIWP